MATQSNGSALAAAVPGLASKQPAMELKESMEHPYLEDIALDVHTKISSDTMVIDNMVAGLVVDDQPVRQTSAQNAAFDELVAGVQHEEDVRGFASKRQNDAFDELVSGVQSDELASGVQSEPPRVPPVQLGSASEADDVPLKQPEQTADSSGWCRCACGVAIAIVVLAAAAAGVFYFMVYKDSPSPSPPALSRCHHTQRASITCITTAHEVCKYTTVLIG